MGGWTRLWLVVTVTGAAWAGWSGVNDYRSGLLDADFNYQQQMTLAQHRDACAHAATSLPNQYNCPQFPLPALPEPLSAFEQHLAAQRDQARHDAIGDAGGAALLSLVLISGITALLLLVLRWVTRGLHIGI